MFALTKKKIVQYGSWKDKSSEIGLFNFSLDQGKWGIFARHGCILYALVSKKKKKTHSKLISKKMALYYKTNFRFKSNTALLSN